MSAQGTPPDPAVDPTATPTPDAPVETPPPAEPAAEPETPAPADPHGIAHAIIADALEAINGTLGVLPSLEALIAKLRSL